MNSDFLGDFSVFNDAETLFKRILKSTYLSVFVHHATESGRLVHQTVNYYVT